MAMIPDYVQKAYQSARLRYVNIDGNEEFKAFVADILQESGTHALGGPSLIRPQGKKDVESCIESIASGLLGVGICLDDEQQSQDALSSPKSKGDAGEDEEKHEEAQTHAQGSSSQGSKAIKKRQPATFIGFLVLGEGGMSPLQQHRRTASLGLLIAEAHQNRGYGREAINWALDWGFRHANLHTVGIGTAEFNKRAAHLYESIGFVPEGRRRQVVWFDRRWYDQLSFSMTEGEWEALRGIEKSDQ